MIEEYENAESGTPDPLLLQFLDLGSYKERARFLRDNRDLLTDRLVNDMGMSQDVFFNDKDLDSKIEELIYCMDKQAKYEVTRLR